MDSGFMSSARKIADFIDSHDYFLLSTHVFPDGDNMGSTLALMEGLQSLGKKVAAYIEGPIPRILSWMPRTELIDEKLENSLAKLNPVVPTLIILDSGDIHRMGTAFDKWFDMQSGLVIANIDHHVSNTHFGEVNWVDADYSSVGEMVYEILRELNVEITQSIAQNLYVSVYTDTGRFSFSNTNVRSLTYASEYVAAGAKPIDAFFGVYANRSFESFRLQNAAFENLTKFMDGKGIYFWVDRKMLIDTNTTLEDTEGLIDVVRTLRGFDLVAFFKEIGPDDIRLSIRAAVPIDASRLMAKFGGGGHPRAAGCSFSMPLRKAIELFVETTEIAVESGEVTNHESVY
ncbi:MAG TPA: bifunctional oligoribonuclease/PAP phosphatase NrnA [Firmicutes bacterium]|nr:bifunctional oligoribonuclease/PAP phosphatase NrnA [Bacillota bacterium]